MAGMEGKVVLVTGASSGIGHATARDLAAHGARVMLTARREARLRDLAAEIEAAGGVARFRACDVSVREAIRGVAEATIAEFGRIDALFNNAGIMPLSRLDKLRVEEWDRMIDVNLRGLLYAIAAVLPDMLRRRSGHIVNVSSIAGHRVFPGSAVYSATKFAVRAISEGLRQELTGATRIRVTVISPGAVESELRATVTDPDMAAWFAVRPFEPIGADAIARATRYALEQPDDVDVNEIVIRPTDQPT